MKPSENFQPLSTKNAKRKTVDFEPEFKNSSDYIVVKSATKSEI
jgi:hypothetical protein